MTREQLVSKVVENSGVDKKAVEKVVKAFTTTVTETVASGESVTLVGFGTFEARKRKARNGVNPQTGKKIKISAKTTPAFKAGKSFKDAVNK